MEIFKTVSGSSFRGIPVQFQNNSSETLQEVTAIYHSRIILSSFKFFSLDHQHQQSKIDTKNASDNFENY